MPSIRYVFNPVALPELAYYPHGNAIECDILAGAADAVLRGLRELEVDRRGSIVIEPVEMAFSGTAAEAEQQLGALAHAPVREEVEAGIREGCHLPSFYVHLVIAGLIGAVGIIANSQILGGSAGCTYQPNSRRSGQVRGLARGQGRSGERGGSACLAGRTAPCRRRVLGGGAAVAALVLAGAPGGPWGSR
ncbi:hypothetical protein [Wenjunlia tyrosinilytica]|jgi:hypothetical protein|uniref:Uncharacterized protein n=1 Tax=Wenjunlia tyrosinilytica TaxID=1544741 RepID=A0A917ZTU8_9ACTN|nr:hypothetical protein [Wenjunlia tyrosinilytica]GGO93186.1 hypothetical protein GCM10012280_45130 [Wenjunlia tyrosinilytica]